MNCQTKPAPPARGIGRPRSFDPDRALRAALQAFWTNGYERTSLDDLIEVMGISRSSAYACFGSKHETFVRALNLYTAESLLHLSEAAAAVEEPAAKLHALMSLLVDAGGGRRGCFLANCISEVAASDPAVDAVVERQFADVEALMRQPLKALGHADAARRAQLLLALALGIVALRKAGLSHEALGGLLADGLRTLL